MPLVSEGTRRTFSPSPFDATRNVMTGGGVGRVVGVPVARATAGEGVTAACSVPVASAVGDADAIVTTGVTTGVAATVAGAAGVVSPGWSLGV